MAQSIKILEEYRQELSKTAAEADQRISAMELEMGSTIADAKKAEAEQTFLKSKAHPASSIQEGYGKLLSASLKRSQQHRLTLERIRPMIAEAKKTRDLVNGKLACACAEIDLQSNALAAANAKSETATSKLAELIRYPNEYPSPEEAGRFFLESLLHPTGPISPFQGVSSPEAIQSDDFALRFQAYLDGIPCTIRIMRVAPQAQKEISTAWQVEADNIHAIGHSRPLPAMAPMMRAAYQDTPGFVIFQRPTGKIIQEFADSDSPYPLNKILTLAKAFLAGLEARSSIKLLSTIPRPDAISISGNSVTFLEPTSIATGGLSPFELHNHLPSGLRKLTRNEFEHIWVFGGAAFIALLLPGRSRKIVLELTAALPISGSDFVGPIQSAARRSSQKYSESDCYALSELIAQCLQTCDSKRPSLGEFRTILGSLERDFFNGCA